MKVPTEVKLPAVAVMAGLAHHYGWLHLLGSLALVLCIPSILRILDEVGAILAKNAADLVGGREHRTAELLLAVVAAARGTSAARDLALEASAILDEMADSDPSSGRVLLEGLRLAVRLRAQEDERSRSPVKTPSAVGDESADERVRTEVAKMEKQLSRGVITRDEYRQEILEALGATDGVSLLLEGRLRLRLKLRTASWSFWEAMPDPVRAYRFRRSRRQRARRLEAARAQRELLKGLRQSPDDAGTS